MSLRIGIVGYGRMGKAVEAEAIARGHEIVCRIDRSNYEQVKLLSPDTVDAVVEFTSPEVAYGVYRELIQRNVKVVTGTTGWYHQLDEIRGYVEAAGNSFLYASNFSIGVNILFELNRKLAAIMNRYPEYDAYIEEAHHAKKMDAPSGTAISLANQMMAELKRKKTIATDELQHRAPNADEVSIGYTRAGAIFGKHTVAYTSEIDTIEIRHEAYNRRGFALGAVVAAEWIQEKEGFFNFTEVFASE